MIATGRTSDNGIGSHTHEDDDERDFKTRYPELADYVPRLLGTVGTCLGRQQTEGAPTITQAYQHIFIERCKYCWTA